MLLLFGVRFTPVLPQWHVKDSGHYCKSAGGRLHINTHTPLTQRSRSGLTMLSRNSVGTYQGSELTRNSSRNTRPQPSRLAEPLWTDPGEREISVLELTSTLKKRKKRGGECIAKPAPQILAARRMPPLSGLRQCRTPVWSLGHVPFSRWCISPFLFGCAAETIFTIFSPVNLTTCPFLFA